MEKSLKLKDSILEINNGKFLISSKNVSLGISFSEAVGFFYRFI